MNIKIVTMPKGAGRRTAMAIGSGGGSTTTTTTTTILVGGKSITISPKASAISADANKAKAIAEQFINSGKFDFCLKAVLLGQTIPDDMRVDFQVSLVYLLAQSNTGSKANEADIRFVWPGVNAGEYYSTPDTAKDAGNDTVVFDDRQAFRIKRDKDGHFIKDEDGRVKTIGRVITDQAVIDALLSSGRFTVDFE